MYELDAAPKKLGRFEITGEIGRGAMGVIYKGIDPKIQRTVALKVLNFKGSDANDKFNARERFLIEVRAAGQLAYPSILTIYDVGDEGEIAYIAMEYVEGGTLQDMIREKRFKNLDHILAIIRLLAEGLKVAHEKNIVHRDIKPGNILMFNDHLPKIADFGLARLSGSSLTTTGAIMGTPNYMAPEQIHGKKVDCRADLFSLGAVFYEMVTGKTPFAGENLPAILHNVLNVNPVPPSRVEKDLPPTVDKFMKKALAKNQNKRFRSADNFIEGLDGIKEQATIGMSISDKKTIKFHPLMTLWADRGKFKPWLVGTGIGTMFLFFIFLAVNMVGGDRQDKPQTRQASSLSKKQKKPTAPPPESIESILKAEEASVMESSEKTDATPVDDQEKETPEKEIEPDNEFPEIIPVAERDKAKTGTAILKKIEIPVEQREEIKTPAVPEKKSAPRAPPKPKVLIANLSVSSTPKGANVYINGKLMGETPYLNRKYKQKPYTLKLTSKGYHDHLESFTLKKDRTFNIALKPFSQTTTALKKKGTPVQPVEKPDETVSTEGTPKKKAKKGFWAKVLHPDKGKILLKVEKEDTVSIDGKYYDPKIIDSATAKESGWEKDSYVVKAEEPVGMHKIYVIRKRKKPFQETVKLKKGDVIKIAPEFQE